jgi:hypothetical protein
MTRSLRIVSVFVLLFVPLPASAQCATTGTVTGKVLDSSGGVLPGVLVSLQSPEAPTTEPLGHRELKRTHRGQRDALPPKAAYDASGSVSRRLRGLSSG